MFDIWIASTAGCFCNAELQGSEWRSRQRMPWVSSWRQAGRHVRDVKAAVFLGHLSVQYNCKAHHPHSIAVHSVAVAFRMNFSNIFTDSYILIQDYIDELIFLPGCANYSSDAARKFTYRYILTISPSWGILGRTLAASKKDAFSR